SLRSDTLRSLGERKMLGQKLPFTSELIKFSITFQFYSSKAHEYVRKSFKNVFPHQKTISKCYKVVNGEPGFTSDFFIDCIEPKAKDQTIIYNLVVDEMCIRDYIEWDGEKMHRFNGMCTNINNCDGDNLFHAKTALLMAVEINRHWKMPLEYFFNGELNGAERSDLNNIDLENEIIFGEQLVNMLPTYMQGEEFFLVHKNLRAEEYSTDIKSFITTDNDEEETHEETEYLYFIVEEVKEDLDDSDLDSESLNIMIKKKKLSLADKKPAVLEEKREIKNVNAKTKHTNRCLTCSVECKNKCRDNLSIEHKKFLWKTHWSLTTYVQRRQFLAKCGLQASRTCKNMNSNFCMSSVTERKGQQNIKKCIAKFIVADHIWLYKPSCEDCSIYQHTIKKSTDENEIEDSKTLLVNHKSKTLAEMSKYKEDSKLRIELNFNSMIEEIEVEENEVDEIEVQENKVIYDVPPFVENVSGPSVTDSARKVNKRKFYIGDFKSENDLESPNSRRKLFHPAQTSHKKYQSTIKNFECKTLT
ncbi:hypothetical protein AGLY_012347, partial [Aphis glycines]